MAERDQMAAQEHAMDITNENEPCDGSVSEEHAMEIANDNEPCDGSESKEHAMEIANENEPCDGSESKKHAKRTRNEDELSDGSDSQKHAKTMRTEDELSDGSDSQVAGLTDSRAVTINDLPTEILVDIFSYISIQELAVNVQSVCVRWSELCSHNALWRDSLFVTTKDMSDDYVVSFLEKAPKLQCFHTDKDAAEIFCTLAKHCKNLKTLVAPNIWLAENIKKTLRSIFTECSQLEELTIPDVVLLDRERGALVGQCRNLRSLTLLSLTDSAVELADIASGCPSLLNLDMNGAYYYSDMRDFLESKRSTLLSLRVVHESEDGACIIALLAACNIGLRQLQLEGECHSCSPTTISDIKTLSQLTSLKIVIPYQVGDGMANAFMERAMLQLLELEIQTDAELNKALVYAVCDNCPNLMKLRFINVPGLKDIALKQLRMCSKLEELELRGCSSLTDDGARHVARCTSLKNLKISNCPLIRKGFRYLINLKQLRYLTLEDCDVSRLPLVTFPVYLEKLKKITFSMSCNVNMEGLRDILEKMPHVTLHYS